MDARVSAKMSVDDFKRVARARSAMWQSSAMGLAGGAATGLLSYYAYYTLRRPAWLTKRHGLLFILGGAALGSYIGAATTGKLEIERLDDVWAKYLGSTAGGPPREEKARK